MTKHVCNVHCDSAVPFGSGVHCELFWSAYPITILRQTEVGERIGCEVPDGIAIGTITRLESATEAPPPPDDTVNIGTRASMTPADRASLQGYLVWVDFGDARS